QGPRHALDEREHAEEDGHDEADHEGRHAGRDLARDEVAQVVLDRDRHGYTTRRRPSTMFRREDWMAGRKPAKIPTPTDTAKAISQVCGVTLKFTSQIETDVLSPTVTSRGMKTNFAM